MAAGDQGEKTEQPTQKRLEEAREEGKIARSTDLTAAVGLIAGLFLLKYLGDNMFESWLAMTNGIRDNPAVDAGQLHTWFWRAVSLAIRAVLPILALLVLISVATLASQSGVVLAWKKMKPDISRVSPLAGAKRLFSMEAVVRLLLGLFKIALMIGVAYWSLPGVLTGIVASGGLPPPAAFQFASETVYRLALNMALVLLILGIVDYIFQRTKLTRSLRMTKQEVRDELKRMEGDPMLRQRRRQIQSKLAMQRLAQEVPKANVIVTNPTEFAVALQYDDATMPAPKLLAKGQDQLALRIRQIAQLNDIPIVQRPPLARALYAGVEIGEEVPEQYYKAVAEVMAYVYQLSGKSLATAD